jgi:hypothetical protein
MFNRHFLCILVTLGNNVADNFCDRDQLALLEVSQEFVVGQRFGVLDGAESFASCIFGRVDQRDEDIAVLFDPLELECIALSNLG